VFLLGTNVLLALVWTRHLHHDAAHRWFSASADDRWATCHITQCGLVRISSNPGFDLETLTPQEAIAVLQRTMTHRSHGFWADNLLLCDSAFPLLSAWRGYRQVTDACLLSLALERGGRLATFDRGILSLARTQTQRAAVLLS
jgi:uncharacterized protein